MAILNLGYGSGIGGLIALVALILVVYDVLSVQKKMSNGTKALWIILSLIVPIIVPIIYYFVVKK